MDNSIVPITNLNQNLTREQLRKKLNKKKKKNAEKSPINEDSLFDMINQVNMTLRTNPEMVKKISKCINNVFDNQNLMTSLISEVENNIIHNQDDNLDTNDENDEDDAS